MISLPKYGRNGYQKAQSIKRSASNGIEKGKHCRGAQNTQTKQNDSNHEQGLHCLCNHRKNHVLNLSQDHARTVVRTCIDSENLVHN